VVHPDADPSEAAQDAVRQQMTSAFGSLPELAQASDKDKQSVAEMLVVLGAFPVALVQSAAQDNDAAVRETAEKKAAQNLESLLHVDASQVDITETGLSVSTKVTALPPDAQGRVTVGKLTVTLPKGWKAEQHDEALTVQPEAAGDDFVIVFRRPGETVCMAANEQTFEEVTGHDPHKVRREDVVAGDLKEGWKIAQQVGVMTNGVVVLAAALRGPTDDCVRTMAVAANADVYKQYEDATLAILATVEVAP
jgi:hypothetical protein